MGMRPGADRALNGRRAHCTQDRAWAPIWPIPRSRGDNWKHCLHGSRIAGARGLGHHQKSLCTRTCRMNRTPLALLSVAFLGCVLGGCSSRTDVSATGNTPAKYSHVWISTQEVWFNTSATAGPDDGGWVKFPLSTPTTVDLVAAAGGNLTNIDTGLSLKPGTYEQIRLIPVDAAAAL